MASGKRVWDLLTGFVSRSIDSSGNVWDRRTGRTIGRYERVTPTYSRFFDARRGQTTREYHHDTGQVFDRVSGRTVGQYDRASGRYFNTRRGLTTRIYERAGKGVTRVFDPTRGRYTRRIDRW